MVVAVLVKTSEVEEMVVLEGSEVEVGDKFGVEGVAVGWMVGFGGGTGVRSSLVQVRLVENYVSLH